MRRSQGCDRIGPEDNEHDDGQYNARQREMSVIDPTSCEGFTHYFCFLFQWNLG